MSDAGISQLGELLALADGDHFAVVDVSEDPPTTKRATAAVAAAYFGASDPALGGDLTGTASDAQIAAGVVGATELADEAYTAAEQTKLAGIATAATANATDAQLRDRATHTGAQPASTITALPVEIGVALSDETTDLTTGAAKVTIRAPFAFTLTGVRASLSTASSSGVVTVDVNEAGVSLLSTALTVDAGEKTSTTAATAAVISDSVVADDAELTFDIDTAGTGARGLKCWLTGTRA